MFVDELRHIERHEFSKAPSRLPPANGAGTREKKRRRRYQRPQPVIDHRVQLSRKAKFDLLDRASKAKAIVPGSKAWTEELDVWYKVTALLDLRREIWPVLPAALSLRGWRDKKVQHPDLWVRKIAIRMATDQGLVAKERALISFGAAAEIMLDRLTYGGLMRESLRPRDDDNDSNTSDVLSGQDLDISLEEGSGGTGDVKESQEWEGTYDKQGRLTIEKRDTPVGSRVGAWKESQQRLTSGTSGKVIETPEWYEYRNDDDRSLLSHSGVPFTCRIAHRLSSNVLMPQGCDAVINWDKVFREAKARGVNSEERYVMLLFVVGWTPDARMARAESEAERLMIQAAWKRLHRKLANGLLKDLFEAKPSPGLRALPRKEDPRRFGTPIRPPLKRTATEDERIENEALIV